MASQCSRATDDIIRTVIHPILKADGFTRTRRTWNRQRHGWVDVVIVQGGAGNYGPHCYFFINLGILVPELYRLVNGREPPSLPIHDSWCTVHARAQDPIFPPGLGQWWNFNAAGDLDGFKERVRQTMTTGVLPFFVRLQSLRDLHDVRTEPPWYPAIPWPYRAVINALTGDIAGAKQVLEQMYRLYQQGIDQIHGRGQETSLASYQRAQETVRHLAAQYGIPLEVASDPPTGTGSPDSDQGGGPLPSGRRRSRRRGGARTGRSRASAGRDDQGARAPLWPGCSARW